MFFHWTLVKFSILLPWNYLFDSACFSEKNHKQTLKTFHPKKDAFPPWHSAFIQQYKKLVTELSLFQAQFGLISTNLFLTGCTSAAGEKRLPGERPAQLQWGIYGQGGSVSPQTLGHRLLLLRKAPRDGQSLGKAAKGQAGMPLAAWLSRQITAHQLYFPSCPASQIEATKLLGLPRLGLCQSVG